LAQPPLANLLLAGVGKAGTTSLYWYMSQHPDVCPSTIKEPRYFLPLSMADADASGALEPVSVYAAAFSRWKGERFRMEGTPHYFHGGANLISGVRRVLDDPRIVIVLRDPVGRAVSIFRFAQSMLLIPGSESFAEFIDKALALDRSGELQVRETRPYWSAVHGGRYHTFTADWLQAFDDTRLRFVFFDDLVDSPVGTTAELCRWLDLDESHVQKFRFSRENRSVPYRLRTLQRLALAVNGEHFLRNHRRIKGPLRSLYYRINGRAADAEEIDAAIIERLHAEFAPDNRRLAAQMTGRGYTGLPRWLSD
jgi:hypothetical protein